MWVLGNVEGYRGEVRSVFHVFPFLQHFGSKTPLNYQKSWIAWLLWTNLTTFRSKSIDLKSGCGRRTAGWKISIKSMEKRLSSHIFLKINAVENRLTSRLQTLESDVQVMKTMKGMKAMKGRKRLKSMKGKKKNKKPRRTRRAIEGSDQLFEFIFPYVSMPFYQCHVRNAMSSKKRAFVFSLRILLRASSCLIT